MAKKSANDYPRLAGTFGRDFIVINGQVYAHERRDKPNLETHSVETLLLLDILNELRRLNRMKK